MNTFHKKKNKKTCGPITAKSLEWTSETPHKTSYVLPNAPIVCTVLCPWGGPARDNKKREVLWTRGGGRGHTAPAWAFSSATASTRLHISCCSAPLQTEDRTLQSRTQETGPSPHTETSCVCKLTIRLRGSGRTEDSSCGSGTTSKGQASYWY